MAYVYEATDLLLPTHEWADDIPLLIAHLKRMGVPALLDQRMPLGGLWGGLSPGWVTTLWLAHMLSQSEGKAHHVQPWVAAHPQTLRACVSHEVQPSDVHDLRLRDLLGALGDDDIWQPFEAALNAHLLGSYELDVEQISVRGMDGWMWQLLPEGVLHVGQGRGWRPGSLKLNVLQASIEPLGLPLATGVMCGRASSEGICAELIHQSHAALQRMRECGAPAPRACDLGARRVLFTGDGVRELDARAAIQAAGAAYLCRLTEPELAGTGITTVGRSARLLDFAADEHGLAPAEGYEWVERVTADGFAWDERRLLLRRRAPMLAAEHELRGRVARACNALGALSERRRGKRRPHTMAALELAVQEILDSHQVQGLLALTYTEAVAERVVRRYRGRPTSVRVQRDVSVAAAVDEAAVRAAVAPLAWELFATNLPHEELAADALLHSDQAPTPGFERMAGRPVSLSPRAIQRDEHAVGLVRLLSLGLRALVLLEAAVYQRLVSEESDVGSGGDRRRVAQQAGERLLEAFREIAMTPGRGARWTTAAPLTPLQRRVLHLLRLSPETYG